MIIVDPPSCCYFKLNVPHGIVSLEQKWGKHMGMMVPGAHCCYCSYKKIAAMITKNAIRFNTPVNFSLNYNCHLRLRHAQQRTMLECL